MSGTPLSDSYRHRPQPLPEDVAELSWMREHRRTAAWTDAALESDLAVHGRPGAALCHVIGEHLELPDPRREPCSPGLPRRRFANPPPRLDGDSSSAHIL